MPTNGSNNKITHGTRVKAWDDMRQYAVKGNYVKHLGDRIFSHLVDVDGMYVPYMNVKVCSGKHTPNLSRLEIKDMLAQFFGKAQTPIKLLKWVDEYEPHKP